MASSELTDILKSFEGFTQKPVNYLTVQNEIQDDIKKFIKSVYDFTKAEETGGKKSKRSALPELIVQDFDEEQIWQEIELQNTECWDHFVWEVSNCVSSKQDLSFPIKFSQSKDENQDESLPSDQENDDLSDHQENEDQDTSKKSKPQKKTNKPSKKIKSSIVDDKFFKLQEMENFLINEEKGGKKKTDSSSDEESVDMFEDIDEDDDEEQEDGNNVMYSDFFDGQNDNGANGDEFEEGMDDDDSVNEIDYEVEEPQRKKKKVTFADGSSDDDSVDEDNLEQLKQNHINGKPNINERQSDFELRQQRLQQTITRLEEKSLKESPWQLKGEVDANKRPQNSLLEEVVDFDLTSRPAPIITEQTTYTLEDIIMRRIKDKAWDDVERKEKPVNDQLAFRKNEILDQSKSKQSLAQVYEAEYLKQKQSQSGEVEEEKEPESHTEIREAMSKLFSKLDALTHYHYTPRAPQADVKIVSNTPAISMEEVAPVATSDAALLAPEEIKKKKRGDLQSKEERTQTDKNRERRKKKKLQSKKGKVEKVTNHRNTKIGHEASDKSLKTSKAFFQQLNDDSTSLIQPKNKKNINKGNK